MKNKIKIASALAVLAMLIGLYACDKIPVADIKKPQQTNTGGGGTGDTTGGMAFPAAARKILLESCTGHKCTNCPAAAIIAEQLKTVYGSQLIEIEVHLGGEADTTPAPSIFQANFHTPEGDQLENQFHPYLNYGLPEGLINRKKINNSYVFGRASWGSIIDTAVKRAPDANIALQASYAPASGNISLKVGSKFLSPLKGIYNLAVFLTEDSIVAPQQNGHNVEQNYVHRHVLRTSATGVFGQQITGTTSSGTVTINKATILDYTIPVKSSWNSRHLSVVACIMNAATFEIIQSEELKVQ